MVDVVAYVNKGAVSTGNNVNISPALPTGWTAGNLFLAIVFYSSPAGSVSTPDGWSPKWTVSDSSAKLYIFSRKAQSGDTAPTFSVSGGSSGDGIAGGIFEVSGGDSTDPFGNVGADTINAAQTDIPVTLPSAGGVANGMVVVCGGWNSGYVGKNALTGDGLTWTEIFDSSTGSLGTYMCCDVGTWTTAPTLTNKTFDLTVGSPTTATAYGKAFVLKPASAGVFDETASAQTSFSASSDAAAVSEATSSAMLNTGASSYTPGASGDSYISVDPNLADDGKKILNYLYGLKNRTDLKLLSGQRDYNVSTTVNSETGQWPAVLAWEIGAIGYYAWPGTAQSATRRPTYQTQWNAGGLIVNRMLPHNPATLGLYNDINFTTSNATSLLSGTGTISDNFNTFLSNHNTDIAWCETNGIVVIMHPLSTPNRTNVWWGGGTRLTPAQYIQLYRRIVTYFSAQGYHNLIWCWSADQYLEAGQTTSAYYDYYPGDDFVDIVGIELFVNIAGSANYVSEDFAWYNILKQHFPTKVLGITAYGPKTTGSEGSADYGKFLTAVKTYCPDIAFWLSWSGAWSMESANNSGADAMLDDSWIVNRNEVDYSASTGGGGGGVGNDIKVVGVGNLIVRNNASGQFPLPSLWYPGNRFFLVVLYSSPNGTIATPSGWTLVDQVSDSFGKLYIYTKIAQISEADPVLTVSGGASGDGIIGRIIAISQCNIGTIGPDTINASSTNIEVTAPSSTPPPTGNIVVDGITYTLSWEDDFNGTELNDSIWYRTEWGVTAWPGGATPHDPNLPFVSGGSLHLPVHLDGSTWKQCAVQTMNEVTNTLKKGVPVDSYVEFKVKMPKGNLPVGGGDVTGVWSGGWFMPARLQGAIDYYYDTGNGLIWWPPGGEIDVWETQYSVGWGGHMMWSGPIQARNAVVNNSPNMSQIKRLLLASEIGLSDYESDWHIVGFHRYRENNTVRMKYRIDGNLILDCFGGDFTGDPINGDTWFDNNLVGQYQKCAFQAGVHGTGPAGSPFEKDFFIILNSCVRGQGPVNQDVNVNPNNDMKEMTVDYVRVYLRETAPPSGFVYQSADTQLITKGRQILDYMWGLHLRTSAQGKKVLSGQTSFSTIDQIRLDTGEWPAIAMESIIGYTGAYPYWQGTTVRTNLLNYWNNGAVVVARLDFGNPVTLGVANSSPISLANKINAYTENNNSVNNALKQSLDICVTDFQWLQSQGCAVIIHMLMEMNQSGFWWGSNINGGDDPAATYSAYINLYRYVVNYFMARCHNLIFQFSGAAWYTGTLRGTHRNTNFYPGDSYVDIVGIDFFKELGGSVTLSAGDIEVDSCIDITQSYSSKIAWLTDYGPHTTANTPKTDYRKIWTLIKNFAPNICGWVSSTNQYSYTNNWNDYNSETVADAWCINQDDMPNTVYIPPPSPPPPTADLFLNPFDKMSAHHRPIGTGAQYGGTNHAQTIAWNKVNFSALNLGMPYGFLLIRNSASDTLRSISRYSIGGAGPGDWPDGGSTPISLRMPDISVPAPVGGNPYDNEVVVFNYADNKYYEFYEFNTELAPTYRASAVWIFNGTDLGHSPNAQAPARGATAPGISVLLGAVRAHEVNTESFGPIEHASNISLWSQGTNMQMANSFQWPAMHQDYFCNGTTYCSGPIPYGSLFALPTEAAGGPNILSLGLSPLGVRLATQMRNYGCYVVDSAGGNPSRAEATVTVGSAYVAAMQIIKPYMRPILNNNSVDAVAGGGTALARNSAYNA